MRPADEPSVISAGAGLVARLGQLEQHLQGERDAQAGCASVFVGQIHGGEIYNQYAQECLVEGTRRWLPGTSAAAVEQEFRTLIADLAGQRRRNGIAANAHEGRNACACY